MTFCLAFGICFNVAFVRLYFSGIIQILNLKWQNFVVDNCYFLLNVK